MAISRKRGVQSPPINWATRPTPRPPPLPANNLHKSSATLAHSWGPCRALLSSDRPHAIKPSVIAPLLGFARHRLPAETPDPRRQAHKQQRGERKEKGQPGTPTGTFCPLFPLTRKWFSPPLSPAPRRRLLFSYNGRRRASGSGPACPGLPVTSGPFLSYAVAS